MVNHVGLICPVCGARGIQHTNSEHPVGRVIERLCPEHSQPTKGEGE